MADWLGAMTLMQRLLAYIALGGSFALAIQFVLLLIGAGHGDADADGADTSGLDGHDLDMDADADTDFDHDFDHDHDHDHAHDALHVFTLRGVIAFLAIFGWTGLLLSKLGAPGAICVLLGSGAGVMAMVLVAMALRAMVNLQQSGNLELRNAIGAVATVYITVPKSRSGRGKVTVLVQERLAELDAITDASRPLRSGERTIVTGADDGALVVAPMESE